MAKSDDKSKAPKQSKDGKPSGEAVSADGVPRAPGRDIAAPDLTDELTGLILERMLTEGPSIYVCDEAGNLLYASPQYHSMVALAARTFDSPSRRQRSKFRLFDEILDELRETKEPVRSEDSVIIGNLTRHYISQHAPVLDENGELVGAYGIYADTTEKRDLQGLAESIRERSEELLRSVADWVWETDQELRIVDVSRGIVGVTGLLPKLLKGVNLLELGEFQDGPTGGRRAKDFIDSHAPFRGLIFQIRDTENRLRQFRMSGMPIFSEPDKAYAGYRGTATDVTDQPKADDAAQFATQDLERKLNELIERNRELHEESEKSAAASQTKSNFLAMMSHELRTPLNAIIGFSEVSAMQMFGSLKEPYLGYSKDILSAARHLLGLINDLLDLARIESNRLTVVPQEVELTDVINDTVSLITLQAEQKGIDIDAAHLDGGWTLWVDPVRTRQIILNLLNNAVKFTEEGGKIGVSTVTEVPGMLDITVWDTGIGIPPEKHEEVFESFAQVEKDIEHRSDQGAGLGLTISRRLARLMGGDIRLESEVGHGSRFTVRLPLAKPSDETLPPEQTPET
jgi:signal transduction histidine kinase